jgi:major type 1 subunit fimbrin (pilin)
MNTIRLFAIAVLAAATSAANAADGTITFNGLVTDKTCDITTPQGKDFTVTLPTVAKSSLPAAGSTAGRTPFTISLSQCSAGDVATYFEPGASVDFGSGRLLNQAAANAAGNVQIQLLGSNNQFLPVLAAGSGSAQANSQWVTVAADGSANLNYYAEYYATAAASAGEVTGNVKYTIIYN